MAGLNYLRTHHVLDSVFDAETWRMTFKLVGEARLYTRSVRDFLDAWKNPKNRLHLGALIGDWDAVHLAARAKNTPDITAHAEKLAAAARDGWLSRLRTFAEILPSGDTLYALALAKAPDLPAYLTSALTDPELAGTAIRIVGDDPAWRCQVTEAFKESLRAYWRYGAKRRAATYLARQGHPIDELLDGLLSKPADYRAAVQTRYAILARTVARPIAAKPSLETLSYATFRHCHTRQHWQSLGMPRTHGSSGGFWLL